MLLARLRPDEKNFGADGAVDDTTGYLCTLHAACLLLMWTPFKWSYLAWVVATYSIRMFAITGGYHRYFAHRSFKLDRVSQFVMAFLAQSSAQMGSTVWYLGRPLQFLEICCQKRITAFAHRYSTIPPSPRGNSRVFFEVERRLRLSPKLPKGGLQDNGSARGAISNGRPYRDCSF